MLLDAVSKYAKWLLLLVLLVSVVTGKKNFRVWPQVTTFLTDTFEFSEDFLKSNYLSKKKRTGQVKKQPVVQSKKLRDYNQRVKKLSSGEFAFYKKLTKTSHMIRAISLYPAFKLAEATEVKLNLVFSFFVILLFGFFAYFYHWLAEKAVGFKLAGLAPLPFLGLGFYMNGRMALAWVGVLFTFIWVARCMQGKKVPFLFFLGSFLLTSVSSGVLISSYSFIFLTMIYCLLKLKRSSRYVYLYLIGHSIPLAASIGKVFIYHNSSGNFLKDILAHGLGRFSFYILFAFLIAAGMGLLVFRFRRLLNARTLLMFVFPSFFIVFGVFGISTAIAGLPLYLLSCLYAFAFLPSATLLFSRGEPCEV